MKRVETTRAPAGPAPEAAELERAARILAVRSRREVSGFFSGSYASAFRGGGMEFEESRPYVPGDDIRTMDWNALARSGEAYVKRFREERDQTLLLALDVSASMSFATSALRPGKAMVAAHAAALLAAAAGSAGDRVGLVAFESRVRDQIPPARGPAHTWNLIRSAARHAAQPAGGTSFAAAAAALSQHAGQHAIVVVLSDFRAATLDRPAHHLAALAARHDVLSVIVEDPGEMQLPRAGRVRIRDPEAAGRTRVLNTSSARVRARYRRAFQARSTALAHTLRAAGSDVLFLRTDRDPLSAWLQFFAQRAARAGGST